MAVLEEFKKFVMRGNVVDLAVGIIIGAAFGKIVASLVADVIMPPIGVVLGGIDFKDFKIPLQDAIVAADGKVIAPAVNINIGNFLQTVVDFTIIAVAVFAIIRVISEVQRRAQFKLDAQGKSSAPAEAVAPAVSTPSETLLAEIRDLLKKQ